MRIIQTSGPCRGCRGFTLAFALIGLIGALGLGGCTGNQKGSRTPTLYEQLGGQKGVNNLVHALIVNVGKDSRINGKFAHTNLSHLQVQLVNLIGQDSGGPQIYTGPDMYAVHKGMHITPAQWNSFMQDFGLAMRQEHLSDFAQARLLGILMPMKVDIVGH